MTGYTLDILAIVWFLIAWIGYGSALESSRFSRNSLTTKINQERTAWMMVLARRDGRVVDAALITGLQNGTAFFASTSLLAIGAALAILRSTNEVLLLFNALPFAVETTRAAWEIKSLGFALIFIYAFFKFAWAYRLFNYTAILIGAVPQNDGDKSIAQAHKAAAMQIVASSHFNRGLRAFFFALGYLGWFVSPILFIISTTAVMVVLFRRQFDSSALRALEE